MGRIKNHPSPLLDYPTTLLMPLPEPAADIILLGSLPLLQILCSQCQSRILEENSGYFKRIRVHKSQKYRIWRRRINSLTEIEITRTLLSKPSKPIIQKGQPPPSMKITTASKPCPTCIEPTLSRRIEQFVNRPKNCKIRGKFRILRVSFFDTFTCINLTNNLMMFDYVSFLSRWYIISRLIFRSCPSRKSKR